MLERVQNIETELQRLTALSEELQFRVERVVQDGTNRVGDLEFRLVELEGGDISTLGETTTLGGDLAYPEEDESEKVDAPELAVGERADFDMAQKSFEEERYGDAIQILNRFSQTYPDSPLAAEAMVLSMLRTSISRFQMRRPRVGRCEMRMRGSGLITARSASHE